VGELVGVKADASNNLLAIFQAPPPRKGPPGGNGPDPTAVAGGNQGPGGPGQGPPPGGPGQGPPPNGLRNR
jgi:hypothetical protein